MIKKFLVLCWIIFVTFGLSVQECCGASGVVSVDFETDELGRIVGVSGSTTLFSDKTSWWSIWQWVGEYARLEGVVDGEVVSVIYTYIYTRGKKPRSDLGVERHFTWFPRRLGEGEHLVCYRIRDIYSGDWDFTGGYGKKIGNVISEYRVSVYVDGDGNRYLQVSEEENLGLKRNQCPAMKGDPINLATGNSFQSEKDLEMSGILRPLLFKRYYNSKLNEKGILGCGWTHGYDISLWEEGEFYLKVKRGDGGTSVFMKGPDGIYWEKSAYGSWVEEDMDGEQRIGWIWHKRDGSEYEFDVQGKLVSAKFLGDVKSVVYDEHDRLNAIIDGVTGRQIEFIYDETGLVREVRGPVTEAIPDGVWVRYGYDEEENLVSVGYADGSGWRYSYGDPNDPHNMTEKRDGRGRFIASWRYDDNDRVVENITRDGRDIEVSYDDFNTRTVTDAYGKRFRYDVKVVNGVQLVVERQGQDGCPSCGGGVKRWVYDGMGRVKEIEYANGRIERFEDFDGFGNAGKVTLGAGSERERVIYYRYHPMIGSKIYRAEASILGEGEKVTIWDYDDDNDDEPNENPTLLLHRVIERGYTRDEAGNVVAYEYVTKYEYNELGQLTSIDGPVSGSGDIVTLTYYNKGDLYKIARPLIGETIFSEYDGAGRARKITDPNGVSVIYKYDARGRLIEKRAEDEAEGIRYEYDVSGNLIKITDEDGVVKEFEYDEYGHLGKVKDAGGNYISYLYDGQGNRIETAIYERDGNRVYWKRFNYQGPEWPGKLYREINPDNTYKEYTYDDMGNLHEIKDELNRSTIYEYDAFGKVKKVIHAGEVETVYSYDRYGNLASVTDAEGHVTTYEYDDMGRLVRRVSPDTGLTTFIYDPGGKVISSTSANGQTIEYEYDAEGRLIRSRVKDGDESFSYVYDSGKNGRGRLSEITDNSGSIRYEYDEKGRILKARRRFGHREYIINYGYSNLGRLVEVVYPSGLRIIYQRDENGYVWSIGGRYGQDALDIAREISHMPFGKVDRVVFGNGVVVGKDYDELYRVSLLEHGGILKRSYVYDGTGNVKEIRDLLDSGKMQAYSYDQLQRLVNATGPYGSISYEYDKVGNRLNKVHNGDENIYSYEQGTNKLLNDGVRDFEYDENGNIVLLGNLRLEYNGFNRIRKVFTETQEIAEYNYDGKGRRIVKEVKGNKTYFLYDPKGVLLAVRQEAGAYEEDYVWLGGELVGIVRVPVYEGDMDEDGDIDGLDLILWADQWSGEESNLERFVAGFGKSDLGGVEVLYVHTDHLGTPLKITDEQGEVVWEGDYLPFGEVEARDQKYNNHIRFPGQYYDEETGFHYNYFRYYDPEIGRYLRPDPVGLAGGVNLFLFVTCSPVVNADVLGLKWSIGSSFGILFLDYGWDSSDPSKGRVSLPIGQLGGAGWHITWTSEQKVVRGDPNAITDLPIIWNIGIGKYLGISFADDFSSFSFNIGIGWAAPFVPSFQVDESITFGGWLYEALHKESKPCEPEGYTN